MLAWMWAAVTVGKQRRLAEEKKVIVPMLAEAPKETVRELVEEQPEAPILVRVFKVKRSDFQDLLPVMGTVRGSLEIDLRFEVSGVIITINFREGDKVKKGDVIALLDPKDSQLRLEYAHGRLKSVEAAASGIKKRLEIQQGLYEAGAIIKAKLEEAQLEYENMKWQVKSAKTEVKLAQSHINKTSILAPMDGVIGSIDVEVGEFITQNIRIASLMGIEDVFVEVGIIERDIDKIELGQKVMVNVDSYPEIDFQGRVNSIFPVVEGRSRTLTTKVKVANPEGLLLSGMFARVKIFIAEFEEAIIIPSRSLVMVGPKVIMVPVVTSQIYPYEDVEKGLQPGVVELRKVEVGYLTTDYAQIASGLDEGELIIIEAQREIENGARVKVTGVEEIAL